MPSLETPHNPNDTSPEPEPTMANPAKLRLTPAADLLPGVAPLKVSAGRFGDLDHSELVHLLDSLDDDRSKSRFRESIYVSVIVYLAIGWFIFYGPKVLFHQGRIVNPADVLKQRDKELTYLDVPKDLSKLTPPKDTKAISDHTTRAQTAHPTLDKKTIEQLQAMRKAGNPGAPAPKPLPDTPAPQPQAAPQQQQPQPAPQQQAQQKPLPPAPPQPSLPDTPKPATSQGKPNFTTATNAGDAVRAAANAAARDRGNGGDNGLSAPRNHQGAATGMEVLSDTLGVDFGPYLKRLKRIITAQWYPLIPEECYPPLNKEGSTLIRFTIQPNGVVSAMHLDGSTHDIAIDKAAWGGITGAGQLPPLPADFKGENLQLRVQFVISHDRVQAD